MACCVLTAYFMSRLIRACEFLDLNIIQIQYNDFDDGPERTKSDELSDFAKVITTKFVIDGMTCAACISSIDQAVSSLDGVIRVSVSLPLSRAMVVHRGISENVIVNAIESRGYGASIGERTAQQNLELLEHNEDIQETRRAFIDAAGLSSIIAGLESLLWIGIPTIGVYAIRLFTFGLAIWIQAFDARIVHRNAWRIGLPTPLTMDTLVSLSLLLGMALSAFNVSLFGLETSRVYWSSVSFLTTVVLGGRLLDLILRKQSSSTFAKLYELQAKSIIVKLRSPDAVDDAKVQYVDAAALHPGDEIEIDTGSIIPCDCYVLGGDSLVDQSTMTGESKPVSKKAGDFLLSGTQNLSAQVIAVVCRAQEDSALESLISSISTSTESTTTGTKANAFISKFVVIILILAGIGFFSSWRSGIASGWIPSLAINAGCERAMAVLASACPCALGLATSSAVMAGLDACRLRGVVVKKGLETFQTMSRLTHIVLDKTGTLTTGRLSVASSTSEIDDWHRLLLCAAERDYAQSHPVAQAIFQWVFSSMGETQRRAISQSKVALKDNKDGNGVEACVQLPSSNCNYIIHAGSTALFLRCDIDLPHSQFGVKPEGNESFVHFAVGRKYEGTLRLEDAIRPEARSVVNHLQNDLDMSLALLTGDVENEAQRVSKTLSIPVLASHSLPIEKRSFVQKMQHRNPLNCVAMVGDGLNDSPALAAADVGICLSMGHTRMASISNSTNSQISDVIITSSNLGRLPEILQIARKTVNQSKWNIRWAVAYNIFAVALAMGIAEPLRLDVDAARAGTMMAFSSISVLVWSLWLRYDLSKVAFQPSAKLFENK